MDHGGLKPCAIIGFETIGSLKTSLLKSGCALVLWNTLCWTKVASCQIWIVTGIRTQLVDITGEVYTASEVERPGKREPVFLL